MVITPFYAGLLALWFLVLSYRVIQMRGKSKINLGDGGNETMQRRIRGHGNFAEYVPLILVMMALLEISGGRPWLLHVIGATLLGARLMHGIAFSFTEKWFLGRFVGTLLTFILLLVTGVLCLWQGVANL